MIRICCVDICTTHPDCTLTNLKDRFIDAKRLNWVAQNTSIMAQDFLAVDGNILISYYLQQTYASLYPFDGHGEVEYLMFPSTDFLGCLGRICKVGL
jgi:hypothetical protein